MRAAPISLTNYFVSDLEFSVNQAFDPEKVSTIEIDDLELQNEKKPKTEDRRSWDVTLHIKLGERPERNLPCSIAVKIVGSVAVDQSVKEENIERWVEINGTSLVFSVAREIVRAVSSRGPNKSILLPTVTFWRPKPEAPSIVEKTEIAARDKSMENAPAVGK
jgi:preprotein translocase subunit SecB